MEKAYLSKEINSNKKPKVALIAFPWQSYAPYKFLSDVIKILEPISEKIILIDGNTDRIEIVSEKIEVKDIGIGVHYLKEIEPAFYSAILWIIKCILAQVKTSLKLLQTKNDVDCVIFYMAYPYYLLPLITSKLLKKKTIEVITRSKYNSSFSKIIILQDPILFRLLDGISPESNALVKELGLDKYKNKLLPKGARYIDTSTYTIRKELIERKNIVGFIGRIRKEKGIIEFVMAIPLIVKENKDIEFLIGGSGDLLDWVKDECKQIENEYKVKITILGWIDQNLPDCLNELKLLVLPTHSDAFPTILLEAMACGTPVLAPPIGAIPSVVRDEETGFIMENNSPESLARNIISVLYHPNINNIGKNAHTLIEKEYSYREAVKRYKLILQKILNK